jgi:hypothetical protein
VRQIALSKSHAPRRSSYSSRALAVVFLQSLGKTTITDDYDLPPVASPRR